MDGKRDHKVPLVSLLAEEERRVLAGLLRVARGRSRMSLNAVAAAVSPGNRSQVSAWESNEESKRVRPRYETLLELAQLYRVSELELFMWGGYLDELLAPIVAMCDLAIKGFDTPQTLQTTSGQSYKVFGWLKWGIALGFRAFPLNATLTIPASVDEYNFSEYPQTGGSFRRHRTRLPHLVANAKSDLGEKELMPRERRLKAAINLHAWMRDIDSATYRFVKTMDEQFAPDVWRKTLNPLSSTSRRRATIGEIP